MGIWGLQPLENDAALDWLESLFENSDLVVHLELTLQQDICEQPDEIRAAAYLIATLADAGLWPHESMDRMVELAAVRLERLLADGVFTNPDLVAQIRQEIVALRATVQPFSCDRMRNDFPQP